MAKNDVVLSESEYEAVKALLRAHKAVIGGTKGDPPYFVTLPNVCRELVWSEGGRRVAVASAHGIMVDESALTKLMLERLERV